MPQAEEKIDDPVVAAKKRELELAQLDAQIADERQKRIAKLFPDGPASIEPPKLTVDDKVSIQSEVLAYRALGAVAVGIVERIAGRPDAPRAYVIHTAEVVAALAAFRSFEMRISAFEQIFSEIAPATAVRQPREGAMAALPPIGLAVSAAGSVVRSLLDIASLFRRDVAIQGRELSIPDMALVLEIANKLANKSADKRAKVFVPELFPLDVASTVSWKQIASKLDDARESAAAARHRVDAMPEGDARASQQKRLDDTAAAFAGLEKSVLAPDDQAKRDELPLLFRGAAIAQVLGDGGRVLYAKVLRAGGNVTTETSRLHGSEVTYGGGVIASFAILDRDGSIIAADTVMEYRERD